MPLLNDPTRGNVTMDPGFFRKQAQQQQQQQLAQLQLQLLQQEIAQAGQPKQLSSLDQAREALVRAQEKKALAPKVESGSSILANLKAQLLQKMFDPNTTPEQKKAIIDFGVFGGASQTVNVGGEIQKSVEEDAKIAEAYQARADEINAANPDAPFTATVKTTAKGTRFIETEPKAPPSAGERIDIADALASEDALNNLSTLFDEAFVGPVTGRIGKVKDVFGENPQKQSEFLAASSAMTNAVIKQITGAQMSEPEAKRIKKQIPLPEDPPTVWRAKRNQSLKNIAFMKKRRVQVLRESGIRVPNVEKTGAFKLDEIRTDREGNKRKYIGNGQWQLIAK